MRYREAGMMKRILLMDDSEMFLEVTCTALKAVGYDVICANDLAQLAEAQRRFETKLESSHLTEDARIFITSAYERLQATASEWARHKAEQIEVTREMIRALREEIRLAMRSLNFHGFVQAQAA